MDKKIKVSAIVAALLAVAPVASSVAVDTAAPSVVQAASKKTHKKAHKKSSKKSKKISKKSKKVSKKVKKNAKKTTKRSKKIAGYSVTDYKKATAFIPRKNIKITSTDNDTDEKVSQTLKAGVMYNIPANPSGESSFYGDEYDLETFGNYNCYVTIKASDVIPVNYNTNKTVKKYANAFNSFLKKLKSNQSLGLKFKKDTTVLMSAPHMDSIPDEEDTMLEETGQISKLRKHTVKKNKIIYIDNNKMDKEDIIKQDGKYYYFVNTYVDEYRNDPYADQWAYIPVDSVTFVKLQGSSDYLESNYTL